MKMEKWSDISTGPLTVEAVCAELEQRGYTVTAYTYPPGTVFTPHSHAEDKIAVAMSGKFKMWMDGSGVILDHGDLAHVPKGVVHSAEVVGNEPVLSLDAMKS